MPVYHRETRHGINSIALWNTLVFMSLCWVSILTQTAAASSPTVSLMPFHTQCLIHWPLPLTSGMPFLFYWWLHLSKALLPLWHHALSASNPDLHIAPGDQMWPTVSVRSILCQRAAAPLICSIGKTLVRNNKTESRLSVKYNRSQQ